MRHFFLGKRPDDSFFKTLDSSMKKNTAFVKKLVCSGDVFKNPSNICNEAFLRKQL